MPSTSRFQYSVVIPTTCKRIPLTINTIHSIVCQSIIPDEILLICNNVTSSEFNYFSEVVLDAFNDQANIINLIFTHTPGLSHARNIGVKHSSNNIVFFSDDDDLWNFSKASFVYRAINNLSNSEFLLVHGFTIAYISGEADSDNISFYDSMQRKIQKTPVFALFSFLGYASKFFPYPLSSRISSLVIANTLGGGSSFVGTKGLLELFPFNESLNSCEDREFFLRISLSGVNIVLLRRPLVTYLRHNSNMTLSYYSIFLHDIMINCKILLNYFQKAFLIFVGIVFITLSFMAKLLFTLCSWIKI